jgi:hypothetical protein
MLFIYSSSSDFSDIKVSHSFTIAFRNFMSGNMLLQSPDSGSAIYDNFAVPHLRQPFFFPSDKNAAKLIAASISSFLIFFRHDRVSFYASIDVVILSVNSEAGYTVMMP